MDSEKLYYVYALVDPTSGMIRYVGVSIKPWNRLHEHRSHARKPNSRMAASKWIADLLDQGLAPQLIILEEYSTDHKSDALEVEKQWIAHWRDEGAPLLNRWHLRVMHRYSRILPDRETTRLKLDPIRGWYYEYNP